MLTRRDLDQSGCDVEGCAHDHSILHIHPACHPSAGVDAVYIKALGGIDFRCRRCGAPVVKIQVAAKPE